MSYKRNPYRSMRKVEDSAVRHEIAGLNSRIRLLESQLASVCEENTILSLTTEQLLHQKLALAAELREVRNTLRFMQGVPLSIESNAVARDVYNGRRLVQ